MTGPAAEAPLVLGLDLGTTEVRAGLFDLDGRPGGIARRAYETTRGPDGAAEQDPADWWRAIVAAVGELGPARSAAVAVAAVGQGPTLVAVDAAVAAVRPAITWMDRRPPRTVPDDPDGVAGFTLRPPILWLESEESAAVARARWLLNTWEWVALRLSGVAAASLGPGEAPLAVASLADRLPGGVPVGTDLGPITEAVAAELGLAPGTRVVSGTNDGSATIVGAGAVEPGDAVDVGGASGGLAVIADRALNLPGLYSAPSLFPGRWILGGAMMAIGASLTWLRTQVLDDRWTTDELLVAAATVAPGADGLVFLPYLAGERSPIWDGQARGVLFGLRLDHGRAHLVRAVLEGGALALRHVAAPITAAGLPIRELRLAGRPASSRTWTQIKADVLGVPTVAPLVLDAAVLGAATIAAVGAGLLPDLAQAAVRMRGDRERFSPRPETQAAYDRAYRVYVDLYPALRPTFAAIAAVAGGEGPALSAAPARPAPTSAAAPR